MKPQRAISHFHLYAIEIRINKAEMDDNPQIEGKHIGGGNLIVSLTTDFAVQVVKFCDTLIEAKKYAIANQMIRSGTSIGANVREAQNAESPKDFYHKMKIAAKEAEETQFWIIICEQTPSYPKCDELKGPLDSIQKVIGKILSSTRKKISNHQ